jgi:hypothetical protein
MWDHMRLAPTKWEQTALRHWRITMVLVFSPLLIVPKLFTNSVILSFCVACALAACFLALWTRTFRDTFGSAVASGLVRAESMPQYKQLSGTVETLFASSWRYAFFLILLAVVFAEHFSSMRFIGRSIRAWSFDHEFFGTLAILVTELLVAFLGSGLCWVVSAGAYWISRVSGSDSLALRPGHSDNCMGLADVGLCTLQAAAPLLTGVLCLALWAWGVHVPWFARHAATGSLFRVCAFVIMLLLFVLAIIVVFVPVKSLHERMAVYTSAQDRQYCDLIKDQSFFTIRVLAGTYEMTIQDCAARLRLVQSMDPSALRLSTWPFDRGALISYGITPTITVIASILRLILRA